MSGKDRDRFGATRVEPRQPPKEPELQTPAIETAEPPDSTVSTESDALAAADPQLEAATPTSPEPPTPATEPRYFMAEGKSVTSLRGILAGERGQKVPTEVFPKDFLEGQKTLDHLVAVRAVLKR